MTHQIARRLAAIAAVALICTVPVADAGVQAKAHSSAIRPQTSWLDWLRLLLPMSVGELAPECPADPAGQTVCGKASALELDHGCMIDPNGQIVCVTGPPH